MTWKELVDIVLAHHPGVTAGSMFGMPCLKRADGTVVACSLKDGGITVKLVDETVRADALAFPGVEPGSHAFDPRRRIREWVHVSVTHAGEWQRLVELALGTSGGDLETIRGLPHLSRGMVGTVDARVIARELERARERTDKLLAPLSEEQLMRQVSPLMSPLVWDFAHIGHFEELWLLRELAGKPPARAEHDDVYDAFAHERSERAELPIMPPRAAHRFVDDVRGRALALLNEVRLDSGDPLLNDGYVFGMVIQHELQHVETMTQTLQLGGLPGPAPAAPPRITAGGNVLVGEGAFTVGAADDERWAYDNERPAHELSLTAFRIDRALVTNAEYAAFIDAGGYRDRDAWSEEGWAWREADGAKAPLFWQRDDDRWLRRRFDELEPVPPREPVQHVSWYEADAYARWAGKRLPTEPEWEKAARTAGAELEHLQGAVWQWTSSYFTAYPGFAAFPYSEYSEVFFGSDYRVLRGGSWVTDPIVARPSFRNWDYPQRRQIFSGIRCAADA